MKKFVSILLILLLSVSMYGCKKANKTSVSGSASDSSEVGSALSSSDLSSGTTSSNSGSLSSKSGNSQKTKSSASSGRRTSEVINIIPETKPLYNTPITVSSVKKTSDGKYYFEVSGKPFLMLGAQIRTDFFANVDYISLEDMEAYFSAAAKLGLTVVQVPIQWSDIEGDENDYFFNKIDAFMSYSNKYNLKMELLWFGSNMCGDSHSFHIPDYVYKDQSRFPRVGDNHFWDMYGNIFYLKMDDADLIAREGKAIKTMMDHVWEWDRTHGAKNPVISVQIENEPDTYPRWRNGNWNELYTQLNEIGKAAKSAKYKVATRVNLCSIIDTEDWVKKIYALDGIDIAAVDPYVFSTKEIKATINNFSANLPGNFPLIAENKGTIPNSDSLILSAVASGGGYNIYELATMKYDGRYTEDFGILNKNLTDRSYTPATRTLLNGLKAAWSEVVLTSKENFAAFNINSSCKKNSLTQTVIAGNVKMTYNTSEGGLAFATVRNGYITAYSTKNGTISFENASLGTAEIGSYNASGAFSKSASASISGNTLNLQAGKVYRIKLNGTNSSMASTTQSNIGCEVQTTAMGNFTPSLGDWSYSNGEYTSYLMFESSALKYNSTDFTNFTCEFDVSPLFIGGSGFGLKFGNGGYIKITPSWTATYVEVNSQSANITMNSEVGKTYHFKAVLNNGTLTLTYNGKQVMTKSVGSSSGSLSLVTYGFYGQFKNVKIT